MAGPMEGVKVVELGVWVAGPAAGGILADWGADVVKIEPPGIGDPCRLFQNMLGGDLPFNPIFEMDNRSKRGIVIDLTTDEGREIGLQLLDEADVFISNVRTSALARLGLDHETLLARNPRLIYASVTGYGLEGPESDRAAYDIAAFWSRSGVGHMLTTPGHHPPFQRGGMGDHGAGLPAAAAVSAALYSREKTGKGQLVSTSLVRQGIYTLSFDLSIAVRFGIGLAVGDRRVMTNPAINCYQDSEGRWFWLVGLEADRHWPPLCRCVGRPEWLDDERFATAKDRAERAGELIGMLDQIFATRPRAEWAKIFDAEKDMWWAPVQSIEEVLEDPQIRAAGAWVEVPDGATTTTLPATPVDFAGTPWQPRAMAPALGQHTDEILSELGRADQIASLRDQGIVA